MKMSNELQRLLEEVADICDSGQCFDMKNGADSRYDGNSHGEGLLVAYQSFLATEEGGKWYEDSVEENHRAIYGD
jgi:hypothetical protein